MAWKLLPTTRTSTGPGLVLGKMVGIGPGKGGGEIEAGTGFAVSDGFASAQLTGLREGHNPTSLGLLKEADTVPRVNLFRQPNMVQLAKQNSHVVPPALAAFFSGRAERAVAFAEAVLGISTAPTEIKTEQQPFSHPNILLSEAAAPLGKSRSRATTAVSGRRGLLDQLADIDPTEADAGSRINHVLREAASVIDDTSLEIARAIIDMPQQIEQRHLVRLVFIVRQTGNGDAPLTNLMLERPEFVGNIEILERLPIASLATMIYQLNVIERIAVRIGEPNSSVSYVEEKRAGILALVTEALQAIYGGVPCRGLANITDGADTLARLQALNRGAHQPVITFSGRWPEDEDLQ